MSHHQHCGCKHDLAYCSVCDVVYCTKCGREWGKHHYTWTNWDNTVYYNTGTGGSSFHSHGE